MTMIKQTMALVALMGLAKAGEDMVQISHGDECMHKATFGRMVLKKCRGNSESMFQFVEDTIRDPSGECLSNTPSRGLMFQPCDGSGEQRWTAENDGGIHSSEGDLCIVRFTLPSGDLRVTASQCNAESTKWTIGAFPTVPETTVPPVVKGTEATTTAPVTPITTAEPAKGKDDEDDELYKKVSRGTCESNGLASITQLKDCDQAMFDLKIEIFRKSRHGSGGHYFTNYPDVASIGNRPRGCISVHGEPKFNEHATGAGECDVWDVCYCKVKGAETRRRLMSAESMN